MSDTFEEITPCVVASNSKEALRDEVIRRMEVYVLELLYNMLPRSCLPASQSRAVDVSRAVTGRSDLMATKPEKRNHPSTASQLPTHHSRWPLAQKEGPSLRALRTSRQHLLLLRLLFSNVQRMTVQTHRDVYYHLVREVPSQMVVNHTVQQLARVLRMPRHLMGVTAGGRGCIAGAIFYHGTSLEGPALARAGMPLPLLEDDLNVLCIDECDAVEGERPELWQSREEVDTMHFECPAVSPRRSGSNATPTAGGAPTLTDEEDTAPSSPDFKGFQIRGNVRFILVIEKQAVFAHLLREGLPRLVPCVLLTAQGFPTHAAHRLLANLHAAVPRAAVVGLVDYNPHGLAILSAYRWPSGGAKAWPPSTVACASSLEGAPVSRGAMPANRFCAVEALRWLGLRATHLRRIGQFMCQQGSRITGVQTLCTAARVRLDPIETHSKPMKRMHAPVDAAGSLRTPGDACASTFFSDPTPQSTVNRKRGRMDGTHLNEVDAPPLPIATPVAEADVARDMQPPPLQSFTPRDTVVLDNLIKQLETRLRNASMEASVLSASTSPADSTRAVRQQRQQPTLAPMKTAERTNTMVGNCPIDMLPHDPASVSTSCWLREAKEMRSRAAKCEFEVLYTHLFSPLFGGASMATGAVDTPFSEWAAPRSGFAVWVAQQLLRGEYI
ncbi:hypothetical protein ABL78_5812 [Leptomonas seymouri]|uniref:DNA topoisomerase (ATP-hydrolyzing) n=1 Tax=Leptomonas seymouri TaxID=5684 RepID=A0A0N0P4C1_LEPSE|nr:hypothetical protein ABL78_5812 [Leptomonas seymouri]|eukprot:KPI85119.1 hypothetical protein ABL78_5812 [Leptomonas seymouri]